MKEKDFANCYQYKVQKPASERVWGCVNAHAKGNLHICDGTINTERYIQVTYISYNPDGVFQKCPCRTILCHIVYASQQCAYKENVHEYDTDLPIVQIQSPIKMCSVLWNIKYDICLQTVFNLITLKRICNSLHCVAIYTLHNFPPFGGNL